MEELAKMKEKYNVNENESFIKIIKNYADKVILKNKVKLYLSMLIAQKTENLIMENNKLSNENNELNEKILALTELINNNNEYIEEKKENCDVNNKEDENNEIGGDIANGELGLENDKNEDKKEENK